MYTSGVGTTIYASPEQLEGNMYNSKAKFILQIMYILSRCSNSSTQSPHFERNTRKKNGKTNLAKYNRSFLVV